MASKLSSLLVKKNLIPVRKLDQAFQRQVLFGGTLDTSLLEMGLFNELEITRTIVEASQIPTIDLRHLRITDAAALSSVFPPKLAQRYSVIPVIKSNDYIGILVTGEIERNKIDEMGFMLGLSLHPRVVPEIRLWQYAHEVYNFPLDDRLLKLLEKLGPVPGYPADLIEEWSLDALHQNQESIEEPEEPLSAENSFNSKNEDVSDEIEITPVPKFEYIEKRIPSDILVPSIVHRAKIETGEFEKALEREQSPEEVEVEDFNDAITKPGFTISPEVKSIQKLDAIEDENSFDDASKQDTVQKKSPVESETSNEGGIYEVPADETMENSGAESGNVESAGEVQDNAETPSNEISESELKEEATDDSPTATEFQTENKPGTIESIADADSTELLDMGFDSNPTETDTLSVDESSLDHVQKSLQNIIENKVNRQIVSFESSRISLDDLEDQLSTLNDRDEILISFLKYASNFFDFGYIFTVTNDAAQGRFAIFSGQIDQHNVRNYLISLSFDSVLKEALTGNHYIGDLKRDEGNLFIIDYLSLGRPEKLFSVPLAIGKRTVAVLFAVSNRTVDLNQAEEFLPLGADLTSKALVSLIRKSKKSVKKHIDNEKVSTEHISPFRTVRPGPGIQSLLGGTGSAVTADAPMVTAPMSLHDSEGVEEVIALLDRLEHNSIRLGRLDPESSNLLREKREQTLEVLSFYFPGMITWQGNTSDVDVPPASAHGPLLDFMVEWGLHVVGLAMDLIDNDSPIIRYYAVFLFEEIRLPEAIYRIGEKLFDPDISVRRIAARVLLSYEGHREFNEVVSNITGFISSEESFLKNCSIEAVGRLRSRNAIEKLIGSLSNASSELATTISEALKFITLREYGDNVNRWNSWWALNSKRHRILWLIEALRSNEKAIKTLAISELHRITGERFGYNPDQNPADNEESTKQWISWWERRGKQLFSGE
ncbi:MAG: hypothetical protein JXR95_07420 [Deltaproteobacteria bacterium]|nr:hypothetical protein [Deltaproteobacteria bacterium]